MRVNPHPLYPKFQVGGDDPFTPASCKTTTARICKKCLHGPFSFALPTTTASPFSTSKVSIVDKITVEPFTTPVGGNKILKQPNVKQNYAVLSSYYRHGRSKKPRCSMHSHDRLQEIQLEEQISTHLHGLSNQNRLYGVYLGTNFPIAFLPAASGRTIDDSWSSYFIRQLALPTTSGSIYPISINFPSNAAFYFNPI